MREINQAGLTLVKSFEKLRLTTYRDQAGKWTIGWGHLLRTGDGYQPGASITATEADLLLERDLRSAEQGVLDAVKVTLTDNQYATLVSFNYNTGSIGAEHPIRLVLHLNANNFEAVPFDLAQWKYVHINGKAVVSNGLVNRRKAEIALWLA